MSMRQFIVGFVAATMCMPLVYMIAKISAKEDLIAEARRSNAMSECHKTGMTFDACQYLVREVKLVEQEASHE
jgi:hypothetical protein